MGERELFNHLLSVQQFNCKQMNYVELYEHYIVILKKHVTAWTLTP